MTIRVAINGFGRIGRTILRASLSQAHRNDIAIVHINDLTDTKTNAHLLKYDSVHGPLPFSISAKDQTLCVDDQTIEISAIRSPEELPWKAKNIDIVFECTGVFRKRTQVEAHLKAGAKKVLISAPGEGEDLTTVYGVNTDQIRSHHQILSNASCTTNCLAPITQIIHECFGVVSGLMTTVHSYTNDQPVLDIAHSDLRRSRAAAMSMIPTSTGAAKAIGLVIPELKGKIDGLAVRVPTPNVSLVDVTFQVGKETSAEEVNSKLKEWSLKRYPNIVQYSEEPLVSIDLNGNPHSAIVDSLMTKVIDKKLVKILAWYDNETGFSYRMLDTAKAMMQAR
jgi:glyceraldehyde 3-phosphate dehydrogenase